MMWNWWALRVLIELAQYLSQMYSIFLDLAPILVNWSDNWEYGRNFGQTWTNMSAYSATIPRE